MGFLMKWIVVLFCLQLTLDAQAYTLNFCQESESEAPQLTEYEVAEKTYHGAHAAIVAHAFFTLGLDINIERLPWQQCMRQARLGNVDGVIGMG
jgi:hypothetical protein